MDKYVFKNTNDLIGYMKFKMPYLTQLKLHGGLYFLWGFYSATMSMSSTEVSFIYDKPINSRDFPEELFKFDFKRSNSYGVYSYTYKDYTNLEIANIKTIDADSIMNNMSDMSMLAKHEVLLFLNYVIEQITEVYDFNIIARVKDTLAWENANDADYLDSKKVYYDYLKILRDAQS